MATSLVKLDDFSADGKNFYAKFEGENPSGSMKDRFIEYVIKLLEKQGQITPRKTTLVEASSGNTGIALARMGKIRGYDVVVCMPKNTSSGKKKMIMGYGARTAEFDTSTDAELDIITARELGKQKNHFFINQFGNPDHVTAYYRSLGPETARQLQTLKEKGVTIDALVAGIGTGASLIGLGTYLREHYDPQLKIYGVSPKSSPTKIEGLHPGNIRGHFEIWEQRPKPFETEVIEVEDDAASKAFISLNKKGVHAGISSGAVLVAAQNIKEKGNYLLLFADNHLRYTI